MSTSLPTQIPVRTHAHAEFIDITPQLSSSIPAGFSGVLTAFCQHTTAGLTINENADPDVIHDLLGALDRIAPWRHADYRHGEGNSAAHLKASLMGSSVTVPVTNGRLVLGTWQSVFFCEFDGPRSRRAVVQLLPRAEAGA
ncbi:MAG: YjbQ family protein [Lentisphaerae bacterium]|jgi:secondary thiamine-phosphate synthase enzyme|nr:YjbQ family protein [Lentisphaerota bacterium]MBT4819901.1 YjbQ family protein [Lentisphaerota bacterium]MBT5608178.1 YjbQ family protein [Lentisphaerota bacterium]MBT7058933.1 YjbQ family protein [Lentisphaerota bacterium]MBT7842836.1 YjbQ family protein [Lentisphaerota bacterium]